MTDPSSAVLKQGDVLRLQVSPQYATIHVLPQQGTTEGSDANFPRNLHNAAELFLKVGLVPNAVKLKDCVDALFDLLSSNPNGKHGVKLGKACVCWQCGYCGIPKDYTEQQTAPGPCANCGETNQINWVRVTQTQPTGGGSKSENDLPWLEEAAMTEEQAKELQAKKEKEASERRAAIEARVAKALKEREEGEQKAS